jgi:flagellar motor switch/type III secretory pathway protein FliN
LTLASLAKDTHGLASKEDRTRPRLQISFPLILSLPIRLDVKIPVRNFRFKDLAQLEDGHVLETDWSVAEDLPVATGDVRLLWAEFAVADQRLTVRVTRVA